MARMTEVGVPLAAELACNSGRRGGGNSAIKCFSFWQKCSKSLWDGTCAGQSRLS